MNWEELTAPEFEKAVAECGEVCILPTGVIEKHGDHVPLGMDAINAHEVAERAAAVEPVMVFPFYYFGQNTHVKCEMRNANREPLRSALNCCIRFWSRFATRRPERIPQNHLLQLPWRKSEHAELFLRKDAGPWKTVYGLSVFLLPWLGAGQIHF